MKTKLSALILSIALGISPLMAVPAQASMGDCTVEGSSAVCTGDDQQAVHGNTSITDLILENAPIKGDVLKSMTALNRLAYNGPIDVDLREFLNAPALAQLEITFDTKPVRVLAGTEFKLQTFRGFDGEPFSLEIGDYFTNDGWTDPPVKQVGFNTFVAPRATHIRFLDGYYGGQHKADGRSLQYNIHVGEQYVVSAYEELSWLGTGKLQASYTPFGEASILNPSATTVPVGTWVTAAGSKTSTGFAMKTNCTWSRGSTVVQKSKSGDSGGCAYKLSKADSGKKLTVKATHHEYWGETEYWQSTTETFSRIFTVQDPILLKLGRIDSAQVGKKLTAKFSNAPSGVKLKYQWLRAGERIKGATKSTYTPTTADLGKRLAYSVTGSKSGMYPVVHTSYDTSRVTKGKYTVTKAPRISGKTVYGQTLKVNPGTRSTKPGKFRYQWLRDGKTIKNATKTTYKLGLSDTGRNISVRVTASGPGFATQTSTTAKTKKVAKAKFTVKKGASVSGKMKVGSKLTVKPGSWSPKPEKYKYRWYRSGAPISKATKSTYKVTSRDLGKVVYVKVTGSKKGYASKTSTSSVK
ncbi:hypothetical protein [Glutamicibacter nicotianae]|uniref:hypothetical protein n=1 Tax=Glutamicibacter nicotianae TaxID=37929 RepID=UPI001958CE67|nr:hypothetical protein [Glutamicibacter nicotianae]MBM7766804.1 hypothetical protein [Glutamicibacter nicotianae]